MNQYKSLLLLAAFVLSSLLILSCNENNSVTSTGTNVERSCFDQSNHKVNFITVESGVKLEVLDWGGRGDYLVLLTGLGDNAHVFDHFAYQFTDIYHVIGITRRGFGKSDKPVTGYSDSRRAQDYINILDSLGIASAVFAGHSIAGGELSELGVNHSSRVKKLVYLDAYDYGTHKTIAQPPGIEFSDEDLSSVEHFISANVLYYGYREPNAAICNSFIINDSGRVIDAVSPDYVSTQIKDSSLDAEYKKITVPSLGIFDVWTNDTRLPYFSYLDTAKQEEYVRAWLPLVQWQISALKRWSEISDSRLVQLHNAYHYIYLNRESEVVREMRKFLMEK